MPRLLVKHYFWVYLWRCFQKRWTFDRVKISLTNAAGIIQTLEGPNRTKKKEGWIFSLYSSRDIHNLLPSDISGSFLVLRPLDLNWITPPAFLVLQCAGSRSWYFLASVITWANSYDKSPLMYIYMYIYISISIYSIGSDLWGTLNNTFLNSFSSYTVLHYVEIPRFTQSVPYWWTFWLFPVFSYFK